MSTVSVRDLRNHGGDVLARVAHGESLTVTRDGDPVALIVPLPRQPLTAEQLTERWRLLPRVDAAAFRRDVDQILDSTL
ncbi:MAG: type II toxin-antitoxin system prevent-host-death family antitoxin [Ornithinimicrobium sp.]